MLIESATHKQQRDACIAIMKLMLKTDGHVRGRALAESTIDAIARADAELLRRPGGAATHTGADSTAQESPR